MMCQRIFGVTAVLLIPGATSLGRSAILPAALEGRVLAGRYRLLSQLGRGGMGSVWRAEHMDLGTPAAVKLIDETFAQSPEALTRFRREAQAAASLRSANVVQILDYGVDGETPYIAMELLEGESLADRIERLGRLVPGNCAAILLQVSKALSRAHEQGIVHRDLKPDNIFLIRDGDDEIAKVLDFGIAKRTGILQTSSDMATRTGSLMGTPYYMSPEQASGRRQVDHRTDIWAFAVIAYECLAGRRPFDDSNLGGLLLSICTENPAPASQFAIVPPAFDAWFARCTAKDPVGRFETIREAAAELCRAVGIAVPYSHSVSTPYSDSSAQRPAGLVKSGAGSWGASRGGTSVATPGAVIMRATSGVERVTLAQSGKQRPPALLIFSGAIGVMGLISAIAALAFSGANGRETTAAGSASGAATPSLASTAPAGALGPSFAAASASLPSPSQAVAVLSSSAPSGSSSAAPPSTRVGVKRPSAARVSAPRQPVRREPSAPARAGDPPSTSGLRQLDRLERDLGF